MSYSVETSCCLVKWNFSMLVSIVLGNLLKLNFLMEIRRLWQSGSYTCCLRQPITKCRNQLCSRWDSNKYGNWIYWSTIPSSSSGEFTGDLNNRASESELSNLYKKRVEQFMWRVMEQQMFIGMTSIVCLATLTKQCRYYDRSRCPSPRQTTISKE